jgi:hypothetical protein
VKFPSKFDVCGSMHHSTIHNEKSNKMQQCIKFIIPYLYEAQHVLGDTLPIIRSLKLHWQSLVFHAWKVVWTCCWWMLSGTVVQGVPRGSILEPIFFLIFINDLPKLASIGTKILVYADDTTILLTSPNLENYEKQINKIFRDINCWLKLNQLVLNYNKTLPKI